MYYLGLDIVEIARIERAIAQRGERFLHRVYTRAEIDSCRGHVSELAARFAGKEAVMKALGTGTRGVGWQEIEILSNRCGAPTVLLHGRARSRAEELGINGLAISLSHSREYAVASVMGERIEKQESGREFRKRGGHRSGRSIRRTQIVEGGGGRKCD